MAWNVSPTIFQILSIIKTEILESQCNHVLNIVDPASDYFIRKSSDEYTSSMLIIHLPAGLNQSNESRYVPTLHFSRICSLILNDITNLVRTLPRENYSEPLGQELAWPEYIFPGYPHCDFHVFTYFTEDFAYIAEQRMFAHLTRRIQNAFFVLVHPSSVKVFRTSSDGQNLHLISEQSRNKVGNSAGEKLLKLGEHRVTYSGGSLTTVTCPVCGRPYLELFETSGKWYNPYDAVVYDVCKSVNATILFQGAAAVPKMNPDEDGEWDEWVAPLADESAAVALFQPISVARLRAFHYPMAYLSDYVTFITAPPRRLRATRNSFARFMSPLTKEVWLCLAAAIVSLFISIEKTIHFHTWTSISEQSVDDLHGKDSKDEVSPLPSCKTSFQKPFKYHQTLTELLKPIVYQGGNDQAFKAMTRNDLQAKSLLALWFLAIIVLGSGYQSAMKSRIVAPEYSKPPKTFRELANSHFGLYAIFWTEQILEPFSEFGLDYSDKLVDAVMEFGYLDPDCYVIIHTGDNACIGLWGTFDNIGLVFSVDVNGKPLYSVSSEGLFHQSITFAFAKNYVGLLEKFNFFIRHVTSSGLPNHWIGNLKALVTTEGKKLANRTKDKVKVYGGRFEEKGEDENSIIILQLKLSCIFFLVTFCIFFAELFLKWHIQLKLENLLIVVTATAVKIAYWVRHKMFNFLYQGAIVWRWIRSFLSDRVDGFKLFKC